MITYDPETDAFTIDATFDCSDETYSFLNRSGYNVYYLNTKDTGDGARLYITANKDIIIMSNGISSYPSFMKYRFDAETNDFVFVYKERFTNLRYWNDLGMPNYSVMVEYQEDKCLIFSSENIDDDTETQGPAYKMDFSGDSIVFDGYDLLDHAVHAMANVSGDRYLTISYTEGDLNARVMDVDTTDGSLSFGAVSSFSGVGNSAADELYEAFMHKISETLFLFVIAVSKYNVHQLVAGYLSLDGTTVSLDYKEIIKYINSNADSAAHRTCSEVFLIDDETFGFYYLGLVSSAESDTYFNTVRFNGSSFDIGTPVLFKDSEGKTIHSWALNYPNKIGVLYNPNPGQTINAYSYTLEPTYVEDWNEVFNVPTDFTDLDDTPTTYSGGQYFRATSSGIEAVDGIILTASDGSEWRIVVSTGGVLSTEAV
jgi:hypothetical protein